MKPSEFLTPIPPPERPTLFRDEQIGFALDVLGKTRLRNLLLVGPAGSGKTQLVREIAARSDEKFAEISISALVAGCPRVGEFEQRLGAVFAHAEDTRTILFADESHVAFGAGSTRADPNELDFANVAKPWLSGRRVTLWLATTDRDFANSFARDPAFSRRFTPLSVSPLTPCQTMEVLRAMGFGCDDDAMRAAIELSRGVLPDSAIDLLDLAHARSVRLGVALDRGLIEEIAGQIYRENPT